jgi:site-specific DNA recombinase
MYVPYPGVWVLDKLVDRTPRQAPMKTPHLPTTSSTAPKAVGIWIRVSTEDQVRGESPEHHEHRARSYAEFKGWQVKEVYHLEAVSGKSVRDHPEAQRMMRHVASGHISGLIFSKLARLARNTRELLDFADYFREHSADLISLQEAIDTTSPAGRLFYTLIAAMAQWEREEIAERVAASVPIRAQLGKPLGGAAPFGFQWKDRQLVPEPKEAPIRKLIYELFLQHRRKKTVARLLNEQGHRTRNGSLWTNTTIDRLLRDPTARGRRRANYTRIKNGKRELKPHDQWVFSAIEPIVSDELWTQCNAVLDQQGGKRPSKRPVQLFGGLTVCACGTKMYVPSDSPKYVCRACRNKIPIGDLEAVFHEQLKQFLLSPDDVAAHLHQADDTIQEKQALLDALEGEQAKAKAEMQKTYRAYQADQLSIEGFGQLYRPLETRVKQLDDAIPRLQGEVDFLKIQLVSSDEILTEAKQLYERWPSLTAGEKRVIVENIVDKVQIGKDEVLIDLCYLPTSSELVAKRERNLRDSSRPPA